MTTLPNMGLDLPVRGDAGAGEWGDTWDEGATKIDAHDHTTGKGTRVPTAGLNINADLPFSALYAPTQLHRLQFSSIAGGALTGSHNKSLFVSDGTSGLLSNELYFRNASGNNVQITSGNTINISVAGGIGGDYASVGAQLNYDDSGKRYTLKEGTSDSLGWARIAAGDLRLFPFGGTGAFYVGHAAPVGIAASYTATWPAALPGSTSALQISSAGAISASNTFANAVTCSSTLTSTGLITATAGVTCAANQSVTISGTGTYKHGTKRINKAPRASEANVPAGTVGTVSNAVGMQVNASSTAFIPLPELPAHARITSIVLWFDDNTNANNAVVDIYRSSSAAQGASISSSFFFVNSLSQDGAFSTKSTSGLTLTFSNSETYWLRVDTTASAAIAHFVSVQVYYDVP